MFKLLHLLAWSLLGCNMARAKKGKKAFYPFVSSCPFGCDGAVHLSAWEKGEKRKYMSLATMPPCWSHCAVCNAYMYSVCFLISHESDHIFSLTIMIFNPSFVVLSWAYRYMYVYPDIALSSRHAPQQLAAALLHIDTREWVHSWGKTIFCLFGTQYFTHCSIGKEALIVDIHFGS